MTRFVKRVFLVGVMGVLAGCASSGPSTAGLVPVTRTMTVTAYCKCGECCNWERTWYGKPVVASGPNEGQRKRVGVTASGEEARKGTIAADARYAFGTPMHVPGYGTGVVQDRGSAVNGEHIDVYFYHHHKALEWGRQRLPVTVWLPPGDPRARAVAGDG